MIDAAQTADRWYVMLFPSVEETARIVARFQHLAERVGGSVNPRPHVTVGYFLGAASPDLVVESVRSLTGPPARIHAAGLFSWSDQPHPLFGYTLSLRVRRTRAVQTWQRAARTALSGSGLTPVFTWEEQRPHMNVLRGMPVPWREALQNLPDREYPITWEAARLLLSRQIGSDFVTLLERPLTRGG